MPYELGSVEASEELLTDLYLNLRRSLARWSRVTFQTPQPKMGYVGQHLTSVVTSLPGGRSGARGKDLVVPGGGDAEIKTCYRVDQLGSCASCGEVVAAVETECPICGSHSITRKDDSKWLLSPKHDNDLRAAFDPVSYYLVLFDFASLAESTDINARIWRVDPHAAGFALCLVDYYFNIKAKSISGAPFNLWPFELKFQVMKPELIYHSVIAADDTITTLVFPGERGQPSMYPLSPLTAFGRSRVSLEAWRGLADRMGVPPGAMAKPALLARLEQERLSAGWNDGDLADAIAEAMYRDGIRSREEWLPPELRRAVPGQFGEVAGGQGVWPLEAEAVGE